MGWVAARIHKQHAVSMLGCCTGEEWGWVLSGGGGGGEMLSGGVWVLSTSPRQDHLSPDHVTYLMRHLVSPPSPKLDRQMPVET